MITNHPLFPNPQLRQDITVLLLALPFVGPEISKKPLTKGSTLKLYSPAPEKVELDAEAMKQFFQSQGINANKQVQRLAEEFETNALDHFRYELSKAIRTENNKIIYISAPIDKHTGALLINNQHEKGQFSFDALYSLWSENRQGHLFIILESDNANIWLDQLKEKNDFSISILASHMKQPNLKRIDQSGAAIFTQKIIKLFRGQCSFNEVFETLSPQFYGSPQLIYQKYGFPFFFADPHQQRMLTIDDQIPIIEKDLGSDKFYKGQLIDDCMTGYGELYFQQNRVYQGFFKNGLRDGYGISIDENNRYYGEWLNDEKHGFGYEVRQDQEFLGKFQGNTVEGMLQDKNSLYMGQMKNFRKHGKGKHIFQDGQFYSGEFVDDQRQGKGYLRYQANQIQYVYSGEFYENLMDGYGVFAQCPQNQTSITYEGEMKQNMKHGFGQLFSPNRWSFHGMWEWDIKVGNGVFIKNTGDRFQGQFEDNQVVGQWVLKYGEVIEVDGQFDEFF